MQAKNDCFSFTTQKKHCVKCRLCGRVPPKNAQCRSKNPVLRTIKPTAGKIRRGIYWPRPHFWRIQKEQAEGRARFSSLGGFSKTAAPMQTPKAAARATWSAEKPPFGNFTTFVIEMGKPKTDPE
jgi:hypothetical protein